jgi:hypothetical protein
MTREYNKAGHDAREYYVANEDPCGYVEETPNIFHAAINTAVSDAIQRVTEIRENEDEDSFKRAMQKCNLAREMAARAATEPKVMLQLWSLRIRKVVESIG